MLMKNLVGKMSQTEMIREYLEAGHAITDLEALNLFRIRRLASRMHDLKAAGYKFDTETITVESGKHIARYRKHSEGVQEVLNL